MGVICTYRQVGQSFTLPHYDWQRAVQEFGIKPGDRVLDVGGGDMPFERADVVTDAFLSESHHRGGRPIRSDKQYVECRVEQMPFADKEFDFVYCNHVLEHTDDPIAACRELFRVAKRGYIEVPCYWGEYVFSDTVHYWLIDWVEDTLVFRSKPYRQASREDTPFKGVVHKYWAENRQEFLQDWQVRHRNLWTIQLLWDGDGFGYRVETLPPEAIADSPAGRHSEATGSGRSNAFGTLYPTLFEEELTEVLAIGREDRVLDVRMTGLPHARANAIADLTLGHRLPFDGQAFDFAYASDLQFVEDPGQVCEELMRVAKRGFIELPNAWASMMLGDPAQRWLIEATDGVLTFRRRRYLDHPFRNILRAEYYQDPDFRQRFDVQYRNVSHVQLEWSGQFAYRVLDDGAEFDYSRPDHAALSHDHFAGHDRAQGVPPQFVAPNLLKALELDPALTKAQAELESVLAEISGSLKPSSGEEWGISAIVHTLNEEGRLEDALKSLQGWVDEIIVVDMHSSDQTVAIARRYTNKVYFHDRIRDFDAARNVGAALARYQWVFYLDADERVPAALGSSLRDLVRTQGDHFSAMQLPYKNHFAGKWIEHAGQWWPGYKVPVLLRKGTFWWDGRMHTGTRIEGTIIRFPCDDPELAIVHHSYDSIAHLIAKQNRYTDAEASYQHPDGATFHWKHAVSSFIRDFQTYYDWNNGSADGPHGFLLSFFGGFYRFATQAKLFERRYKDGSLTIPEREVPASVVEVLEFALAVAKGEISPVVQAPKPASLLWQAPLFDPSGYADEARNFLIGLDDIGTNVKAFPLNWSPRLAPLEDEVRDRLVTMVERELTEDFCNVVHIFPTYYQRNTEAKRNIGRTMFETDRLPAEWVAKCNEMDEIWVPSDFNLETFARAGVHPEKLFKLPGTLEPARYSAEIEPLTVEGVRGFNFLSLFDWSLRKGWDVLLKAYLEEFTPEDDVALILKVYSSVDTTSEDIQARILDYVVNTLGHDPGRIPDIVFLDSILTEEAMLRLYKACDAYVMPSRGEGWGRPLMEAMAMGLPTIGTGWSGNTEFMTPDNSYLVDFELVEVSEEACQEAPAFRGHRWAEPSVDHLRQLMRHVFTHRDKAQTIGARARSEVLAKYDRKIIAKRILDRLEAMRSEDPQQGGGQVNHNSSPTHPHPIS